VALAVLLALGETWGGIALAYASDWPTTFWIVMLSSLVYFASFLPSSISQALKVGGVAQARAGDAP
jgi:ABC-type Mn2+/Zn2+ transport system permease subunit